MRLDLLCSTDELRPTMNHVKMTAKECVATNAHTLGVIPTSNIFDADFIKGLGDSTFLIHSTDWKQIKPNQLIYWENETMIGILPLSVNKRPIFIKVETEKTVGKYPDWEKVVPMNVKGYKVTAIEQIGLNAGYLFDLQKALNFISCKLSFYAVNKAIGVYTGNESETLIKNTINTGNYGIIMPTMIKN